MTTYSSVACAEEHVTINESHDVDGGKQASVTVRCAWADRHALVADVIGNKRAWPHGSFTTPPQAKSASIVPAGTQYATIGQSCVYIDALVTLNYSTEVKDLVSESLEPSAEFITQDYKRFRWGSKTGDVLLEQEAPGKLVRGLTIVRTIFEVPPPLPLALLTSVGKTNDAVYISRLLGLTFEKETLLYTPPQLSRTITSAGSEGFNITLKLMYKPETWNKFWRAKSRTYEEIWDVEGDSAHKNNPPGNFSAFLF